MSNLHPVCLKWIEESTQKMLESWAKSKRQHKKIDTCFMLHQFTMTGVVRPCSCGCLPSDLNDAVLASMHKNHGLFNRLYWEKLKAANVLGYLREAAEHDLTTGDFDYGIVARKAWLREVLAFYLVDEPNKAWFN